MTLQQEAYTLIQRQPESNLRILIDLLRTMAPAKHYSDEKLSAKPFRRTGAANGTVCFPKDFDEHFDDLNEEIAAMFYEGDI